ncbi:hypothetical protein HGA89_06485, partial [bacterium]|nr:hypothetical protein [bacterium]
MRVLGADGRPVKDAYPDVVRVNGLAVSMPGGSGANVAVWLARLGHATWLIEKRSYPRDKVCGDGLTPRAIYELEAMGFDFSLPGLHRCRGLRSHAGGITLELDWPDHPVYPNWGAVMRRADLDGQIAALAAAQGATVLTGTEARPILEDGRIGVAGPGQRLRPLPEAGCGAKKGRHRLFPLAIRQQCARRQPRRAAQDARARMGAGAAQVEAG